MNFCCKAVLALLIVSGIFFTMDSQAGNPLKKLGRGVCNVGFGGLEIPLVIYDVNQEEGGLAALTYGSFMGIGMTLARMSVGVVEIITFPFPLPGCADDPRDTGWGYGPIMRPEWIIDPNHNAYNIFYQDTAVMD